VSLGAASGSVPPGDGSLPILRRAGAFQKRLVVLMAARLALALVSLGVALALDTAVDDVDELGRRGLYGTVAFAFLTTALYGIVLPRIRQPRLFAAINIAADIAIVSALVHLSGGPDSVFSFLYLLVATYGALLFDRRGALVTAGLGVVSYGGVLLASHAGAAGAEGGGHPGTVLFTIWASHAGAIVLVAALASFLANELQRTGEALRQRTTDLRQLETLHQRTVESLVSGLLTTDTDGRVTSFNPEAERITAVAVGDALGAPVEEILPFAPDLGLSEDGEAGAVYRIRVPYRNPRGEDLHLGIGAYTLRDVDGAPSGRVLIFQDVSKVVEMEAELRRSERLAAVGRLSASIAHEIRNPLAAISGSIQILDRDAGRIGTGDEARRLRQIVLRETDRLNALITDFLHYARPGPLEIAPVVLEDAVSELLEMFEAVRPEKVRLDLRLTPGLAVAADAAQLRQVFWNLALNACQAMPGGGSLEIASAPASRPAPQEPRSADRNGWEEKDGWVEITVRDTGVGIPSDSLDQIFDPFFTTKPEGSGLGLATVHRIVVEHRGSIRVESAEGSGTAIRIRLPGAEVSS
jgi:two-component system sensor histidine kinase PilS (NtrC family)